MTNKISMGKGGLPSDWKKGLLELTIPKDKVEWEIMWRERKTRVKEMIDWEERVKERRDG